MVSVCYSKAKVAAACASIVYFLSYVPYMYLAIREEAAGDRISAVVKSLVVSNTHSARLLLHFYSSAKQANFEKNLMPRPAYCAFTPATHRL